MATSPRPESLITDGWLTATHGGDEHASTRDGRRRRRGARRRGLHRRRGPPGEVPGQQLTDYWFYVHRRWVFDLVLSNPSSVRLYRMSPQRYVATLGCAR